MFTLSLINPATGTPFFTRPTRSAVWSTTRTGDERLRAIIDDISLSDAVALFDKTTFAFVRISKDAEIAWQGVVTDVQLTYNNNKYALVVNAVGYSFLFRNEHFSALYSTTDTSQFFLTNNTEIPQSVIDSRVRLDTSQNIQINIRANSTFYANERICVAYRAPDKATQKIGYVETRCLATLPPNFIFEVYCVSSALSNQYWTVLYTISPIATNVFQQFPLFDQYSAVVFAFRATANITFPAETLITIDKVRLCIGYPPISAVFVVGSRIPYVINNVTMLSDLLNVVVEDITTAELLDMVCQQDNLEYEILEPNVVELRDRNAQTNRTKYRIVADTLSIARDATTIANSFYARYRDVRNSKLRTERADEFITREVFSNGVFRDKVIDVDTYDYNVAIAKVNEEYVARRGGSMRLRATTRNVATASQSPVPVWKVRAGAIAGIVNLGRIGYGQVSEVIIDRTDYDAATDTLTIESQIDAL